jgi:hypothetical protein
VEVTSQEEQDALDEQFGTMGRAWTGLRYVNKDDKWVWEISGTPLDYSNWLSGEPSGNEFCTEIVYGSGDWNDLPCDLKRVSICELPSGQLQTRDSLYFCPTSGSGQQVAL